MQTTFSTQSAVIWMRPWMLPTARNRVGAWPWVMETKLLPDAAFKFQAAAIELKQIKQRRNVILTTENEKVAI